MDLQTIEDKLRSEEYFSDKEFEDDVNLVWDNAIILNYEGSEVYIMAQNLKSEFQRLISLSSDQLTTKRVPSKGVDNGKSKNKQTGEKPLSPQEIQKLSEEIKLLNETQMQEIYSKMKDYVADFNENFILSLERIPTRVARDIIKYVNTKLPLVNIQKKIKPEKVHKPEQIEREPPKPKHVIKNPYEDNDPIHTDLPIVTNQKQPEMKQINIESSDSSLISDLESD